MNCSSLFWHEKWGSMLVVFTPPCISYIYLQKPRFNSLALYERMKVVTATSWKISDRVRWTYPFFLGRTELRYPKGVANICPHGLTSKDFSLARNVSVYMVIVNWFYLNCCFSIRYRRYKGYVSNLALTCVVAWVMYLEKPNTHINANWSGVTEGFWVYDLATDIPKWPQ